MVRCLIVIPVVLLMVAAEPCPEPESSTKTDLKKLQGEWTIVKALENGKPAPKDISKASMVIKDDKLTIKDPMRDEVAKFTIDAKKNPREIDIRPVGAKELVVRGIYKLEKDEFTICFTKNEMTRPTKFDETGMMIVFKRVKK